MYSELTDYLNAFGLQSITLLFKVCRSYVDQEWQIQRDDAGYEILTMVKESIPFPVQEVDSVRLHNHPTPLYHSHYSVHITAGHLDSELKLKHLLRFLIMLKRRYRTPQIFINNIYEISERALELEDFLNSLSGSPQPVFAVS